MPPRNPFHILEDILDAIRKIRNYTTGMTYEIFSGDSKTIDAVIRNLEVIGEAAAATPADFQNEHPGIPWEDMRAMRNVLIHEYFGVSVPSCGTRSRGTCRPLPRTSRRFSCHAGELDREG